MPNNPIPLRQLNDGSSLPALGFGTYGLNGSAGVASMVKAIQAGYRLLDSAFNYENEGAVGLAVRQCGVPREELQVTSKLPGRHHKYDEAMYTVEESLYRTGLEYYDLYLVHWPNPGQKLYVEAWQALLESRKRGLIRSIGVCNFLPEHIRTLINETGVAPAINQVELHPYFPQPEQLESDRANGVVTQSWSPLGRAIQVLGEPVFAALAEKHCKTVPQVILRWHVQLGALPIPKASSPERQMENMAIFDFELSAEDMAAIATLARPDGRLKGQDPASYEEF